MGVAGPLRATAGSLHRLRPVRVLCMPCVACVLLELAAATACTISRSGGVHNNQRVQRPDSRRSRLPRLRRWSGLGVGGPQHAAIAEPAVDQGLNQWTEEVLSSGQPVATPQADTEGYYQSLGRQPEEDSDSDHEMLQQVRGLVFKCEASGCRTLLPDAWVRWALVL